MKNGLMIFLAILLLGSSVCADVTSEILDSTTDSKGWIDLKVQLKTDGTEIQSGRSFNGKQYFPVRLHLRDIEGLTKQQKLSVLNSKISSLRKQFIKRKFLEVKMGNISQNQLNSVVGLIGSDSTVSFQLDTDFPRDGVMDELWTVQTDGTKNVTAIP